MKTIHDMHRDECPANFVKILHFYDMVLVLQKYELRLASMLGFSLATLHGT
jgi:hypothetical protein